MTIRMIITTILLLGFGLPSSAQAAGTRLQIKGEIIDTWCYLSGIMGGPDAVTGSAHHTCAIWCAAGGIPVGLLGEDGTIYMVLKLEGKSALDEADTLLSIQSHAVTADGLHYIRDGVNYLVVEKVVADAGITNLSHEDFDVVPPFAIPKPKN